ncbi:effector-associated domain 2-containing protein [Micromonospora humi]|uniref:Uncharacterized protein n=1 Tax=Micromonospora humi TaxID=745366 RepID=A0A1C5H2P7_9ACTN|nr:hypothetical protein [Micromonospora humi]SCG40312.1 hypothetical protein GA0070213_102211 [Micromonospora humi]
MTHPPSPGAAQRHRIEEELVDLLSGMRLLQEPDSRRLMVGRLRERLADHGVNDYANPRDQSIEVARVCLGDLAALVDVVALFEPAAAQLGPLHRLRHEVDAFELLAAEDWTDLRPALTAHRPESLGWLYQRATDHKTATPPSWCVSAWDVFVYLSGQNAPPRGLPPSMLFLVLLEHEVDTETAQVIRHRNRRQASLLELTADLDRRRAQVNAGDQTPEPYVYLVVQVEPDLAPGSAGYTVSHYRQWQGAQGWHSRRHGQLTDVAHAELEATVERIVQQMEIEWSDRRADVAVELVLPVELLNEDVAWWRKEAASVHLEQKVLAMDYPVVVRSLNRLRQPEWHRAWRRRWEHLQAEPAHSRLFRSRPHGPAYLTRLEAELTTDPRWSTLLLSAPPTPANPLGFKEVMTALRAGLPVIVWHRTRPSDTEFWEEIRDMTADGRIARLPVHARRARLDALALEPHADRHNGRHLVVLWDDPERTPELHRPDDRPGRPA